MRIGFSLTFYSGHAILVNNIVIERKIGMRNVRAYASLTDRFEEWLRRIGKVYWVPFLGTVLSGFAAYTFLITNKLINYDDLAALFGTGASLVLGRWGRVFIPRFFPTYSVPWLWGIFSIFVMGIACCMIVKIFEIRSKTLQFLLGGGSYYLSFRNRNDDIYVHDAWRCAGIPVFNFACSSVQTR